MPTKKRNTKGVGATITRQLVIREIDRMLKKRTGAAAEALQELRVFIQTMPSRAAKRPGGLGRR